VNIAVKIIVTLDIWNCLTHIVYIFLLHVTMLPLALIEKEKNTYISNSIAKKRKVAPYLIRQKICLIMMMCTVFDPARNKKTRQKSILEIAHAFFS